MKLKSSTRRRFIGIAVGTLGLTFIVKALKNVFSKSPQTSIPTEPFEFTTVRVNDRGEEIERSRKTVTQFREDLGNGITLEMVEIPGGTFMMGAPASEVQSNDSERPQHQVTLKSFFMGKYQVTQAQWQAVANLPKIKRELDPDPAVFKGKNRPVESVCWFDAVEFCARLSKFTGKEYTLPSEAQWEYACRAGTTTPFYFGETITSKLANYRGFNVYANEPRGRYREVTTPVGSFPPNAFGLYDMHGNVWEWCADTWHDSYEGAPTNGSAWIDEDIDNKSELLRLRRGGYWRTYPEFCRSANRAYFNLADDFILDLSLRVCCGIPSTS